LEELASSFLHFHERFSKYFVTRTKSLNNQSLHYLSGLMQAIKKNIERMTEVVPDADYQSVHHFVSQSPWEHQPALDQVARDCDRLLGGGPDTALIIDESGLPKKGNESVGVARQWCGRLGKTDNCQVGVFAALSHRDRVSLIDERLYLPEEWTKDKKRCKKAGIPEDVRFKTKSELALEMIKEQRAKGTRFAWTGLDGGYGKDTPLLCALDDAHEVFVADVHKDQTIYPGDPELFVPDRQGEIGKFPTRLVAKVKGLRVDKWVARQPKSAWRSLTIRDSSKGKLRAEFLFRRVWIWNKKEKKARCWHLIVRREEDSKETLKYSLSNAPETTTKRRLAFMQGQRFFVERALQDAKSHAGMDHYQVRGWRAWHHHMSMVMMAMLFMLETRITNQKSYPLLSCGDIETLLAHFLPRRDVTKPEVLRQMEYRHYQRQLSIDSAYNNQRPG
jgi:SRSO17 transposase